MARKRKSWTSINFTFKLNTLCLASILFLIKIYLRVHARKNYTTVEERQKNTFAKACICTLGQDVV